MNDKPTAPNVGTYKGREIPAWIETRGARYEYVGIAVEDAEGSVALAQLAPDEVVIAPGLIYRVHS